MGQRIEEWRSIVGFEGKYQVSNKGNVKRVEHKAKNRQGIQVIKERMVTQRITSKGYCKCTLQDNDGREKSKFVHRLVAETFLEKPDGCTEVNHKDEVKTNNSVENLEWCSHSYNSNYGERNKKIGKTMTAVWSERKLTV